jgi:hypothetical protein
MIENGRKQVGGQGKIPFRELPMVTTVPEMARPGLALSLLAGSSGRPNAPDQKRAETWASSIHFAPVFCIWMLAFASFRLCSKFDIPNGT